SLVKPFVADVSAFEIVHRLLATHCACGRTPSVDVMSYFAARKLRLVNRKSHRQAARRVDLAKQSTSNRLAAARSRIPSFDDRRRERKPRHASRPAGFKHHYRVLVDGSDRRN